MVTGGTIGIGFAIAERMAMEGGIVHICSRKKENVETAVKALTEKGLKVFGHQCNVSSKEQRDAMVGAILQKHDGVIDVLVCNAATALHQGKQLEIEERTYDKMYDLNVKSQFFLIKECIEGIRKSKSLGKSANIMIVSS